MQNYGDGGERARISNPFPNELTVASVPMIDIEVIVARLSAVVPAEVRLTHVSPGTIQIRCDGGGPATIDITDALAAGAYASALWDVLSFLQDQITRHRREPWPRQNGGLALPQVREEDGTVHAWYGTGSSVALDVGRFAI